MYIQLYHFSDYQEILDRLQCLPFETSEQNGPDSVQIVIAIWSVMWYYYFYEIVYSKVLP